MGDIDMYPRGRRYAPPSSPLLECFRHLILERLHKERQRSTVLGNALRQLKAPLPFPECFCDLIL